MATSLTTKFQIILTKSYNAGLALATLANIQTSINTIEVTYNNTAANIDYNAVLTIASGTGQINLAAIEDVFRVYTTIATISTIAIVGLSTNTAAGKVTINRSAGDEPVFVVQKGASAACEFPLGLGACTSIDLEGTTGDVFNIFITGKAS